MISSPPGAYRAAFYFAAAQVRKGPSVQWVLHFREHPARLAGISDLLNFFHGQKRVNTVIYLDDRKR